MRTVIILAAGFALNACGGGGGSAPAPQPPANSAPAASDVFALTLPGAAVSGVLAATDADGDALTFALVNNPTSGAVTLSGTGNQDFEYTPNGGFAGEDNFAFNAGDGTATSNAATVTITVNTPPSVTGMGYTTSDIGTVSGAIIASDAEGDGLTFAVSSPPAKGSVTSLNSASGEFVYTPDASEDGVDSFEVVAIDAAQTSAPGVINIEIFDWVGTQQLGSTELDQFSSNALIINDDGSHLQGGITFGQIGSDLSAGASDNFLRRTDRRGNQTLLSQFGDSGENGIRGLFQRPQGDGFYVVAYPDGDNLYRFDNDGTEVFSVPLPVSGGVQVMFAAYWAAVDDDGDIFVLSWVEPNDPNAIMSGLVSKVSGADGTLIWQRELPTSIEDPVDFFIADSDRVTPRGIDIDSSGHAVISGEYWDASSVRPCSRCGFIAKLDADSGALHWLREPDAFANCGIDGTGRFNRVTVAADDTLYLNGLGNGATYRATDGLVARYSADGMQELWQFCDNSGPDSSNYYRNPLITSDSGIINFGTVAEDAPGYPPSELVVDKFDVDGNVLWQRRIGATKADGSDAYLTAGSIVEDDQGILYITGSTDGELTGAANAGGLDAFIMRLSPDGSVQE